MSGNALHFTYRSMIVMGASFAISTAAFAQRDFIGYHQYPQFRSMSGLPGSSVPITREGEIGTDGALALSSPIAYSLGGKHFIFGGMSVSDNLSPKFFRRKGRDVVNGNGTAQIQGGYGLGRYGGLTVGGLLLSGRYDSVLNLHWALPWLGQGRFAVGVGAQDVFGGGAASGTNKRGDGDSSTSEYAVGTYALGRGTYISGGWGLHRFAHGFGNISTTVFRNLKLGSEYDGYNFNANLVYLLGVGSEEKPRTLALGFGVIRGKYAAVSANLAF